MLILVIDDDETILAMVAALLKGEDRVVRTTTSAAQVLAWLGAEQVAVLISDYDMPEMNGAQLSAYAKVIQPTTVRLLLTAADSASAAIECINQGEIYRYLSKPTDMGSLRAAVTAALLKHQELLHGAGKRDQDFRQKKMLEALEAEFPGLTKFELDQDDCYTVYSEPLFAAVAMGADLQLRDVFVPSPLQLM